jgi:hypothetical protein
VVEPEILSDFVQFLGRFKRFTSQSKGKENRNCPPLCGPVGKAAVFFSSAKTEISFGFS